MKSIIVALFLSCVNLAYCQGLNLELGFNDSYHQYSSAIITQDDYFYFSKTVPQNSSFFTLSSLLKVDTLGNVQWESSINPIFSEYTVVNELIPSESGGAYILGFGMPTCDVGSTFWYIQKYNSNGWTEWNKVWGEQSIIDFRGVSGLSLNDDGKVRVNYYDDFGSKIYEYDPGSALTDSLQIDAKELKHIDLLSGFKLVGASLDSLFGFDSNGNTVSSFAFAAPVSELKSFNDSLYVLTTDSVYCFSGTMQLLHVTAVPGIDYSSLKVSSQKVQLLSNGTNEVNLVSLDHDLNQIGFFTIPLENASTFLKDFNGSHLSAVQNFGLTEFDAIRVLDLSLVSTNSVAVPRTDIGIVDFLVTGVDGQLITTDVYDYYIYADVAVKNFGTEVLNECRINHFIDWGICGQRYYTQQHTGLSIQPGQTQWISLGVVHHSQQYFTNDTILSQVCFYTSHPNRVTDLEVANDELCQEVLLGYAGIIALEKSHRKLVKIYDLTGREIEYQKNKIMLLQFDDGSVEKVFVEE